MKYCNRCLYPDNHPLNIVFDEQGVCSGCRIHEEKDWIDWSERLERLKNLIAPFKDDKRSINNCVVPISGARDSYFVVHVVKNILGLNPLLVTYNKHYNTKLGIRNLSYLQSIFGCPLVTMTVSPEKVKRITKETLRLMGSMYWHCIAGQTVFPVQIAHRFKIPLIIWGCHQGLDQVGMYSHLDEVEMTRKYREEHDLMGCEAEDLLGIAINLTEADLEPYFYPENNQIDTVGIRGIYLGNYLRWDSKAQHEEMIQKYGYETRAQQRTFDTYNDVDCFHYSGLHDYIKDLKYGYSKVTDHVSREIRLKRLTRKEGIKTILEYQSVFPKDIQVFLDWIDMPRKEFCELLELVRNPDVWKSVNGVWTRREAVEMKATKEEVDSARLAKIDDCIFNANSRRVQDEESQYHLLGRGWADR